MASTLDSVPDAYKVGSANCPSSNMQSPCADPITYKTSVAMRGWQEMTRYNCEHGGSASSQALVRTGYFLNGVFSLLETTGRGVAAAVICNPLSRGIASIWPECMNGSKASGDSWENYERLSQELRQGLNTTAAAVAANFTSLVTPHDVGVSVGDSLVRNSPDLAHELLDRDSHARQMIAARSPSATPLGIAAAGATVVGNLLQVGALCAGGYEVPKV